MTNIQRELSDSLKATWVPWATKTGVAVTTSSDQLIGPFNSFLLNPIVARKFEDFLEVATASTTLSEPVRQVIILMVGSLWAADYALYAHRAAALATGLSPRTADLLANGEIPDELAHDEKIAARITHELCTAHRVNEALYAEAEGTFGVEGLFDIATLVGQYHTVCTTLALFNVPAPDGCEQRASTKYEPPR